MIGCKSWEASCDSMVALATIGFLGLSTPQNRENENETEKITWFSQINLRPQARPLE